MSGEWTMPTKLKSTKRRTSMKEISAETKTLSSRDKKKIKGGLLPYIEQDNLKRPTNTTGGTSNITDGTSNTITPK